MKLESRWFREDIRRAAREHGLDASVIEAIVLTESGGRSNAYRLEQAIYDDLVRRRPEFEGNPRRIAASYGLMQIMFPTAYDLGFRGEPEELFLPWASLDWGCRYLARMLTWSKGDLNKALAAYNGGKKGNEKSPYRNQAYVTRVAANRTIVDAALMKESA